MTSAKAHAVHAIARPFTRSRVVRTASDTISKWREGAHTNAPFLATRRRLVIINLAVVSAILLIMATAVYAFEARAIDQQTNQEIQQALTNWTQHGEFHDGNPDPTDPANAVPYQPTSPNVFALILNSQGHILFDPNNVSAYCKGDLVSAQPVLAGRLPYTATTVQQNGHDFRLFTVPLLNQTTNQIDALQVGMSLDAPEHQLRDLLFTLAIAGAGVLLLTALASLYLADRALGPMRLAFERQRQFTAAASHELRTPLAYVRSQSELVLRHLQRNASSPVANDPVRAATATEDMLEIVSEVDYMTRLVRDLLLLARDEGHQQGVSWQAVNLPDIAAAAVEKIRPAAEAKGLSVHVATAASNILVRGDPDRLRELALILLENAVRYTSAGGTITVAFKSVPGSRLFVSHRGHATLTVSDTGIGISPEAQKRIFEPFYRADEARTGAANSDDRSSAGLGLALAQWIVHAHNGEISVNSELGKGSAFTISLPLIAADDDE